MQWLKTETSSNSSTSINDRSILSGGHSILCNSSQVIRFTLCASLANTSLVIHVGLLNSLSNGHCKKACCASSIRGFHTRDCCSQDIISFLAKFHLKLVRTWMMLWDENSGHLSYGSMIEFEKQIFFLFDTRLSGIHGVQDRYKFIFLSIKLKFCEVSIHESQFKSNTPLKIETTM